MRLVVLTGEGAEHRYVARRLGAAFPGELAAVVVARTHAPTLRQRIGRYARRYTVRQIASRVVARAYAAATRKAHRRAATAARLLPGPGTIEGAVPPEAVRVVASHNGAECLALVREIQPDVIAVYGTAMIRRPMMELASRAILNMHTGLSPWYRGSDSTFWALHNEEPELVGVTVHVLDPGIDSGAVIATARPPITADDDEDSLFCKSVLAGTDLYVAAIRDAAAGTLRADPQPAGMGREYRFVDRTVAAERRVERLVARGLLRRFAEGPSAAASSADRATAIDGSRA